MTIYDLNILPEHGLGSAKTINTVALSDDIRIGLDEGSSTLIAMADTDLVLDIKVADPAPNWVELCWLGGQDALCHYHDITIRLSASAKVESWVHPVLRLHKAEGFRDVFSKERLSLTQSSTVQDVVFNLTPRDLDGCNAIDVHLFFEPCANSISMHSLCVTAFR